ncbi:uncharacterized protein BDZ99DRAFT_474237 [Mytilinidion resinicola]|uniref:Uncharacterized protein n=1 Tax=Mytilinidion resinicola TaxID=574789 RepID=A0A6A6Z018_9PEZI|nr:uncharacterized protein BDZ99DRAFT_474237 [Mytilinidion resinicola]KAF2813604.1 hypothetical protein BDZ99DRAFT_474237 [Mytilinidion resinicola]
MAAATFTESPRTPIPNGPLFNTFEASSLIRASRVHGKGTLRAPRPDGDAKLAPACSPPLWEAEALEGQETALTRSDPIVSACTFGVFPGGPGEDTSEPSSFRRSMKDDSGMEESASLSHRPLGDGSARTQSCLGSRSLEDGPPDRRPSKDCSSGIAEASGTANSATSYDRGAREEPNLDEASAPDGPEGRREPQILQMEQFFYNKFRSTPSPIRVFWALVEFLTRLRFPCLKLPLVEL